MLDPLDNCQTSIFRKNRGYTASVIAYGSDNNLAIFQLKVHIQIKVPISQVWVDRQTDLRCAYVRVHNSVLRRVILYCFTDS